MWRALSLFVILCGLFLPTRTLKAQDEPHRRFYELINGVRLSQGLPPYGSSTLLHQAAQRHAEDIAELGNATHEGSDGSDYRQRIREARYQAWNDGLLVNEAIWIGLGTAEDAVNWFRSNPEGAFFTDRLYREIGIGFAEDNGVRYFVINVGSRPGVLPIFINDGADVTDSPVVSLRLTNEEAVPLGEGNWMGQAIEVRVSNSPEFDEEPWQPWEPVLPWLLADVEPGDYAVYVEFRDGAGRTAVAEDTIRLVAPGEAPPTATPFAVSPAGSPAPEGVTTEPSETPFSGTVTPPEIITPAPTMVAPTPQVSDENFTPFPTWTPLPDETPVVFETTTVDWPVILALAFQGLALLLGVAAFLRRR
ncbi:MAG: CAP domain-containing protein [Anaerolineae bacterium]